MQTIQAEKMHIQELTMGSPEDQRLIRLVLEARVSADLAPSEVEGLLVGGLLVGGLPSLGVTDARMITSIEVVPGGPSQGELNDMLALFLLTQFPEFNTDTHQNIVVVNMLTTALGAALSYPLANSEPGTTNGQQVVEAVVAAVRNISANTANTIALQRFEPAGSAN